MIFTQLRQEVDGRELIIVVLEPDNVERMKTGDPVTLSPVRTGGAVEPIKFTDNVGLLIAYEEDIGKVLALKDRPGDLINYLRRNMKAHPLDGVKYAHVADKVPDA